MYKLLIVIVRKGRPKMKKLFLASLILIGLLSMTGCADIKTHLTINRDGSADLEQRIAFEQSVAGMVGGIGKLEDEYKSQGYEVKPYDEGQLVGVIATKHLQNAADVSKIKFNAANNLFANQKAQPVFKITKGFFVTQYQFNGIIDLTSINSQPDTANTSNTGVDSSQIANAILGSMKFKFILTLPEKPQKNNAGTVSSDGKTLEWLLVPGRENTLQVAAQTINYLNIAILTILALLICTVIVFFLIKRNKRRSITT
jgi:hypothetical protein